MTEDGGHYGRVRDSNRTGGIWRQSSAHVIPAKAGRVPNPSVPRLSRTRAPDQVVPIPGTKRRQYVQENVDALEVEIAAQDLERLDEIAPKGVTAGARYSEPGMAAVNR